MRRIFWMVVVFLCGQGEWKEAVAWAGCKEEGERLKRIADRLLESERRSEEGEEAEALAALEEYVGRCRDGKGAAKAGKLAEKAAMKAGTWHKKRVLAVRRYSQAIFFYKRALVWGGNKPDLERSVSFAKRMLGRVAGKILKEKRRTEEQVVREGDKATLRKVKIEPKVELTIHFDTEKATLRAEGKEVLRGLRGALSELLKKGKRLRIIGHTDVRGKGSYNRWLSDERAKSVRGFLLGRGNLCSQERGGRAACKARIQAVGRGSEDLLRSERTEVAHAANRRVEVEVED